MWKEPQATPPELQEHLIKPEANLAAHIFLPSQQELESARCFECF